MRFLGLKQLVEEGKLEIKPEYFKSLAGWTLAEKREFAVKDNIELGDWDDHILETSWDDLPLENWGIDISGWSKGVKEDDAPDLVDDPVSKLGEIYQLGKHRLMCGDSTKIEDVEKLMNGQKADMVFTDPPFNIDLGHITNAYESHDDNMNSTKYQDLLSDMLGNLVAVSGNTPFYVMSSNRDIGLIKTLFNDVGIHYHQLLIWAKPSGMMGNSDYIQNYEAITYGYTGEHKVVSNKGLLACEVFNKDENITTVGHPTSRPIELLKKFISNSSSKDDVVVDLFGGSGSTLIACEQLNRICYMMELDPKYCDVIRKRYYKFIGKENEWQDQ
jgi:DNA modification methylase